VASFEDGGQVVVLSGGRQDQDVVPGLQPGISFVRDELAVAHDEADPGVAGKVGQVRYGAALGG
jgi:hypothetical protein